MSINPDPLEALSLEMRKRILKISLDCGHSTHLGGGLSLVETLAVLYGAIMNVNPENPEMESRDRFILSKGHGVLAYFAALAECGFITEEKFGTFMQNGSDLIAHPVYNPSLGIESSNGSLGQGLSFGIGLAWGALKKAEKYRVYVVMGDGECNEGSVWEAAQSAAHLRLGNLTAVVDSNELQSDGKVSEVLNTRALTEKWKSFGWNVIDVDGHNCNQLIQALELSKNSDIPTVIIANTVKGKGISFMENNNAWHHARMTKNYFDEAMQELSA